MTGLVYLGSPWSPGQVAGRAVLLVLLGRKPLRRMRDAGWCTHERGAWRLTAEGMRAVNAWVTSRDWQRARK